MNRSETRDWRERVLPGFKIYRFNSFSSRPEAQMFLGFFEIEKYLSNTFISLDVVDFLNYLKLALLIKNACYTVFLISTMNYLCKFMASQSHF